MSSEYLGGFSCVSYKLDNDHSCERHLFVKQHDANSDAKPSDRTLFILNISQFLSEKSLKFMYKDCGEIERIFLYSKPKTSDDQTSDSVFSFTEPNLGYKVGYVVFKNALSLKKALKCKELPPISCKIISSSCGMKKWTKEYNSSFINTFAVQKEIDSFMAKYDAKVEDEKVKAKEMESVQDEEGWITITKHSKKPKISRDEAVSMKIVEKQKKAEQKKTLLNFYRCQLRQSKMEHILELRKKFEKDKERIAQMRANRKFKPF